MRVTVGEWLINLTLFIIYFNVLYFAVFSIGQPTFYFFHLRYRGWQTRRRVVKLIKKQQKFETDRQEHKGELTPAKLAEFRERVGGRSNLTIF